MSFSKNVTTIILMPRTQISIKIMTDSKQRLSLISAFRVETEKYAKK